MCRVPHRNPHLTPVPNEPSQPTIPIAMPHAHQATRIDAWALTLITGMGALMLVMVGRVAWLKHDVDPQLIAAAGRHVSVRSEINPRGDVLDRRGRVLAVSSIGYRLFVDPGTVEDLMTVALDLADVIGMDPMAVDRTISERADRRYVVIDHLLNDWQVAAVREAKIRGVGLEPRLVRHYPNGDLAAPLVGMVGFEHSGLSGAEYMFDHQLEPVTGTLEFLRDAQRRPLWIEPDGYVPGQPGAPIRLSIDLVIQDIAQRELQRVVDEYEAGGGRLVVLDCRTGELLAMCDIIEHREDRTEQIDDPGRDHNPALGRNRCVTDPYEPGSTFKPFVWAVATELGLASPEEILPTSSTGPHRTSRGRIIRDVRYVGPVSWQEVLVRSLNAGMAMVAERMTHTHMREAIARFGFGERTGVGLPGESPGIVTSARDWSHYTQTSVCMGHEIAVTPLQMVRAFSAFARDGTLPPLRITAWMPRFGRGANGLPIQFQQRVISPEIAMMARGAMRDVVREGTGRLAQSEKYQLFGKSGTAQLPRRDGRGYHDDRYVSGFIAGAPFEDPRIVVLCVVDDPNRAIGHFGGRIAGPVVRNVIDQTLEYLGVPPEIETEDGRQHMHVASQ